MDWQSVLQTVIAGIVSLVVTTAPIWVPMLIAWLKERKIIRTQAQEQLAGLVIGEAVEAVEAWARKQATKPSSEEKMAKAQEIVMKRAPMLKDSDDVVDRIETALFKKNGNGS
jgi:biopolymer transport protein ExbB/TolQ